jgi:hypothetical protein
VTLGDAALQVLAGLGVVLLVLLLAEVRRG